MGTEEPIILDSISLPSKAAATIGVATQPGQIALIRIPCFARSSAMIVSEL
jgi:hypothetical protein